MSPASVVIVGAARTRQFLGFGNSHEVTMVWAGDHR